MYSSHLNDSPETASHPWTQPPEDFYHTSPSSLSNTHDQTEAVSPADSQAPIMNSWTASNGEYPAQPDTSDSTTKEYEEPIYPAVPMPTAYSSAMGVVNGEVGGSSGDGGDGARASTIVDTPTSAQFARYPIPPLSAGLKTSNTIFSTYEEQRVAELEEKARTEDKRDLAVKLKVRLAKVVLRSINCACSTIVLSLVASTFAIFNATRNLKPRNGLPPWSSTTPTWPQITILVISSISLLLSLFIMYSYWKGGHNKAERVALHATIFAGAVFIFTIAMWSVGIGIMQASRAGNNNQDLWGWACKDNTRRKLFQDTIDYILVCRQQDWVVVCAIIEISAEFLSICVYLFAFYRLFYTKRKLRKSLNVRDEARSSLWLAKLKEQKDTEEDHDHETSRNTTYNQLNSNTAYINAEEGRAVPILQPAPGPRHFPKQSDASDAPLAPLGIKRPPPALSKKLAMTDSGPLTSRSVSFMPPPRSAGRDSL